MTPRSITLSLAEYEELVDARDHAVATQGPTETLSAQETAACLAAKTPLAFWRRHRGLTQAALAAHVRIDSSSISSAESGLRGLGVRGWLRVSKALNVPLEDLLPPELK